MVTGPVMRRSAGALKSSLSAVPVTVIGYDPGATLGPTVSLRLEEPPVVTDVGVKPADTPAGRPLAESATFSATPETSAVEIDVVPEDPAATDTGVGLAAIEKSLVGSVTPPDTETLSKPTLLYWPVLCEVTNSPMVAAVAIVKVFFECHAKIESVGMWSSSAAMSN